MKFYKLQIKINFFINGLGLGFRQLLCKGFKIIGKFVNVIIRDCYIIKLNGIFFNEIGCIYFIYYILYQKGMLN